MKITHVKINLYITGVGLYGMKIGDDVLASLLQRL